VFKDPSASADERYKIVTIGSYKGRFCVYGFVSLNADAIGSFTTLILDFTGNHMELNAYTRLGGDILVELADASQDNRRVHAPKIPGRTFEDCDPITGDHHNKTVTWRGESDLSAWAGKPVRLRFRMRRASFYAMGFK